MTTRIGALLCVLTWSAMPAAAEGPPAEILPPAPAVAPQAPPVNPPGSPFPPPAVYAPPAPCPPPPAPRRKLFHGLLRERLRELLHPCRCPRTD